jgi:hypothetical protein
MLLTFQNFLDKRNIPASFVDDQRTIIRFTINNIHYLFSYNYSEDPAFVKIIIPNAGSVDLDNPGDVRMLYNLTTSYKVGKAFAVDSQVWFSAEAFLYTKEGADSLFLRLIQVLQDMLNQYRLTHNDNESNSQQ